MERSEGDSGKWDRAQEAHFEAKAGCFGFKNGLESQVGE